MKPWARLVLLALFLLGVVAIGKMTGFTDGLTVNGIRESMREAGVGGFFVFIATFCVGQLLYIPGFVFVMVSGLAYGPLWGSFASLIAANISVAVSFVIVRTIGGQPLAEISIKKPFLQRPLDHLEDRPIRSMNGSRLLSSRPFAMGRSTLVVLRTTKGRCTRTSSPSKPG